MTFQSKLLIYRDFEMNIIIFCGSCESSRVLLKNKLILTYLFEKKKKTEKEKNISMKSITLGVFERHITKLKTIETSL